MRSLEEISAGLRDRGFRVTPQRQCIIRMLDGDATHPTVDALYERVRAEMPTISRKTVYQTVYELETLGEVRLLDVGTGSVRVDPAVEREHHHLVCASCGEVTDVPLTDVPHLAARFRREFRVTNVEVIFRGTCRTCGT